MIIINIKNIDLKFKTDKNVFSEKGVDKGTLAMLSKVDFDKNDKVLDLGCGFGVVGILVAKLIGYDKVIMCDISEDVINCSKENAKLNNVDNIKILLSDGLKNINEDNFTIILSNPPYHTDFKVAKEFIEDGFRKLAINGKMLMVTKRLTWYKKKLISVFGGVKIYDIDGYYVFIAEKKSEKIVKDKKDKKKMSKKLMRKLHK